MITAIDCPPTASQRSRTIVCRRSTRLVVGSSPSIAAAVIRFPVVNVIALHVPRGFARVVGSAFAGSSGQGCFG